METPDLDTAVVAAADDARAVKLKSRHAIVVRGQSVDWGHLRQGPDAYRSVGSARHQGISAHLQLSHERRVALKDGLALTRGCIPYSHARVETAGCDSSAVKGYGVDVAEVTGQGSEATAFQDAPNARCGVIAARYNKIAVNCKASNACLVAAQYRSTTARDQIPHSEIRIPGPGYGCVAVGHFQTSYSGRVSTQQKDSGSMEIISQRSAW